MAATLKLGDRQWATKEGSLLAYNDENNNIKPLPFDFTRASSATRVNKQGLIETVASGVPRIDYTDANGALLLEPQRTNVLLQSNQFDTTWALSGATLTSGQIGVGGSSDAWLLEKNALNGRVFQNLTSSGSQTYSVYAKSGTNNWVFLLVNGGDNPTAYFDLQNGVLGVASGGVITSSIVSAGNGWYRISMTFNESITRVRLYVADSDGYSGETSGSIYIQSAQLEVGSYATSYIPTQGSAVTVVADVCTGAGNDQVINSAEGVLYAEIAALANDGTTRGISINDNSNNNRILIRYSTSSNSIAVFLISGNVLQATFSQVISDTKQFSQIAVRYSSNNFAFYLDGIKINEDNSVSVPSPNTIERLDFNTAIGGSPFYGKVRSVKYFPTALTDEELEALTQG